jgi:hypothetical protein
MPEMDGDEVYRKIREHPSTAILPTAWSHLSTRARSVSAAWRQVQTIFSANRQ